MRKIVLSACAVMMSMTMLAGCTKSNIVNAESQTVVGSPVFETQEDIKIDWQQVADDAYSLFHDKKEFPNSVKFQFYLNQETKEIMLLWAVDDKFPVEELNRYAEAMLKSFNDIVATQDFSIGMADEKSYGGLWKDYGVAIGIMPDATKDDRDSWYLDCEYPAGEEIVLPDTQQALEYLKKHVNDADETEEETEADSSDDPEDETEEETKESAETKAAAETKAQ